MASSYFSETEPVFIHCKYSNNWLTILSQPHNHINYEIKIEVQVTEKLGHIIYSTWFITLWRRILGGEMPF